MRPYDSERVVDEIERLRRRFGDKIKTLIFDDDIFAFGTKNNRVKEFSEGYVRRGVGLPYVANANSETVNDDAMMDDLKGSGCKILKFGVESGSPEIRRLIKRPASEGSIVGAFDRAHKRDIHTSAFLMIGLPTETNEQIDETMDLTARINPGRFRWSVFFPFPGTEAHRFTASRGLIDEEKMRGMNDYFSGSCLRFPEEQLLRIDKLDKMFHWEVNARMPWSSAGKYREMVDWVNGMSRAEWEREEIN